MQILQLATALPEKSYTTEQLLKSFPCELPEKVKENVLNLGVLRRHLIDQPQPKLGSEAMMDEQQVLRLCRKACTQALENAKLSCADVDYLIATYDASPFLSPGLSQLLIGEIGLDSYVGNVSIHGAASTAFLKALVAAENHLSAHPESIVLVCVSGVSSYWFHNQVRGFTRVMEIGKINSISEREKRDFELRKWVATMQFFLFGDGVAAAVLTSGENGLIIRRIAEVTNVRKEDCMAGYARLTALNESFKFGFYSHLDKEIPSLGVKYSDLALKKLLGENEKTMIQTAKKWAIHTGSEKILNLLAEHHRIDATKLEESHAVLKNHGNLAGASLPFILKKIMSANKLSSRDQILMVGYGWGFTAAACLLENQ